MTDTPGWIAGPTGQSSTSDRTAAMIDDEIQQLIAEASVQATNILVARREELDRLVHELLNRGTLGRDQLERVFDPASEMTKQRAAWPGRRR